MFRLPEDAAVINRYGFNSEGHIRVLDRLRDRIRHFVFHRPAQDSIAKLNGATADQTLLDNLSPDGNRSLYGGHILGINLGKNKTTAEEDAYKDYVLGVQRFAPYADALVINISSPNTPGLRALQRREVLQGLLKKVVNARNETCKPNRKVPLLVKIAPDLTEHEVQDIAMAVKDSGIDGVIVSNTTIDRPLDLKGSEYC
jgi:dihydroorotate dehydrogenase